MMYYVCFTENVTDSIILNSLKENFRHVEIFREDGLYISPNSGGLYIDKLDLKSKLDTIVESGIIVIKYNVFLENRIMRSLVSVNTCVGVVKDILNIRNIFIQTPYQLYKYLLNNGGEEWHKQSQ